MIHWHDITPNKRHYYWLVCYHFIYTLLIMPWITAISFASSCSYFVCAFLYFGFVLLLLLIFALVCTEFLWLIPFSTFLFFICRILWVKVYLVILLIISFFSFISILWLFWLEFFFLFSFFQFSRNGSWEK